MMGLMQDRPLLISSLIDHAAQRHGDVEIVSRTCEGHQVRTNYREVRARAAKLAHALRGLGIGAGDRVATLAWNTHRHLELYFAVSGIGAVLHTVNPRLHPQQIEYIVSHAESRALFFDAPLSGLVSNLAEKLTCVETLVAMTDEAHMPAEPAGAISYERLLAAESGDIEWPLFDERTASSLCYTSGTTGNPKGVLYSHRSTLLHAFAACAADGLRIASADSILLVVPLFHVNAWGVPYAAAMSGAKLVLPGPWLDGRSLYEAAVAERCNVSLGVPTVWLGFFKHLDETPAADPGALTFDRVVIGGSAAPRAIIERFRKQLGAFVIQAWGMTETGPLSSIGNLLPRHRGLSTDEQIDVQVLQGRAIYGVELRLVDDEGREVAQDGEAAGHLQARGPWVVSRYFKADGPAADDQGWFATGDVAKIHADGFVQLTDRSKDVIKSGGEWISSIDLENAALAHPAVQEAAVVGIAHPRWQERPLMLVVVKAGAAVTKSELLSFLSDRFAKWQTPEDVVFVDALPHTATGKIQKMRLREQFAEHYSGS